MINCGGLKIYLVEVEFVLVGYFVVVESVIIVRVCLVLGECVYVVVVMWEFVVDVDLCVWCVEWFLDYKVFEIFDIMVSLLLCNVNGKVFKW